MAWGMKTWSPLSPKLGKIVCLAFCFIAFSSHAAVTLTAIEDNYIWKGGATAVQGASGNGSDTSLITKKYDDGNARIAYFKFDLAGQSFVEGQQVTFNVTLASSTNATNGSASLMAYALNSGATDYNWAENAITWNTAPGSGLKGVGSPNGMLPSATSSLGGFDLARGAPAGGLYSVSFVYSTNFLQVGNTMTVMMVVTAQETTDYSFAFGTSENGTVAYRPTLVFGAVPEPGRALLLMFGLMTFLGIRRR